MPTLVDCWKRQVKENPDFALKEPTEDNADYKSVVSLIKQHLDTGVPYLDAAKASVQSHLDEAHAQLQSIYEQVVPKEHPLQGQTYYRGTNPNRVSGEDTFYSAHKGTAEEYSAGGPGGQEGAVQEVKGETLPKNLYQAFDKEELAKKLGINKSLYGTAFDNAVKEKLQSQGYEGVRYEAGTALGDLQSGGQEEIHVFSKSQPISGAGQAPAVAGQLSPEVESSIRSSRGIMPDSPIQRLSSGNYMVERGNDFAFFDPKGNKISLVNVSKSDFSEMERIANAPTGQLKTEVELPTGKFTKSTGQWRRRLSSGNAGALVKNKELISQLEEASKATPVSVEGKGTVASTLPEQQISKIEGGTGEEVQKGQEGRQAVLATERVQPTATSTEPHVSGIANRLSSAKVERGEVGEIAPGQGTSINELRQTGLQMPPEQINQHVSDVMAGTGDIVKQGAALTAEEARLSQRSSQLSREAEADPTNTEKRLAADNAFKDLTDFHNGPIATLKTRWSDAGRTLQGEIPVDLSTFNGMREAWLKDTGKPPPPEVEPILRDTAKKVATANGEADTAVSKVGQSIDQSARGRKLPSYEQVRENILQRLKERAPCN